jgi:exosome complex RNA-binding protein Rrp4
MKNKNKSTDIQKFLLFPGETYEFNEHLLHYEAFGYSNGLLTSKRCGQILVDSTTQKLVESENEEVYRSIGRYYSPKEDDFVIGTITYKSSEFYKVDIGSYTHAILNSKDFEGATKKVKPNLNIGDTIFARVEKVNKFDAPVLSCISESDSKTWTSGESFFGVIKDGMVYNFPKIYTWEFMSSENHALTRLRDFVSFEVCVGYNGKLYINSDNLDNISKIYKILIDTIKMDKPTIEKLIHETFIDKMMAS